MHISFAKLVFFHDSSYLAEQSMALLFSHMKSRVLLILMLLVSITGVSAQNFNRKGISEPFANSFIDRFADPEMIRNVGSKSTVDWQTGYDMFALEHIWRWTGEKKYYDYIKNYVDIHTDADGNVKGFVPDALDHFIPGYAFLLVYEQTGDERYAKAVEHFRDGLRSYPRTSMDMFIHGVRMPQVWVDGVFMGQMFLARYAKTMNHPEDYAEIVRQITGASKLCGTPDGLMVHAWAVDGESRWPGGGGRSPEVWSEGLGWIAVLLADLFDWMPEDTPGYKDILDITVNLCKGLKGCQDRRTGLWFQVVGKPDAPGNWNETSGSAMFTYLLQRCVDRGFIPADEYQPVIDKAYDGLLTKCIRNSDGFYNLFDCSSIGIKRNYEEYISQPHEINTFASMASFMLGTGAVEWRRNHPEGSLLNNFYCTDYSQGKIFKFENGFITWEHDAPLSNDLSVLDNGNILFTIGNGVLELDPQDDTVFCYKSDSKVFACQRLKNGNTFIGECTAGRLLEVTPSGKIVKSVSIVGGETPDDGFIRNARRLDNGHYLVAHYSGRKVVEYSSAGRTVWEADVPGGAHSVARLKNGHTLVSAADKDHDPKIIEFDRKGNIVWTLSNADFEGEPLKFMSGFQYIPESDSFVITNWQGHDIRQKGPHILWVSRDKEVLGTLPANGRIETVSSIFIQ